LHDDDAAPSPVDSATVRRSRAPSARSMRFFGTHAWTIAESRKPRTSAHHTSHAIWNAAHRPSAIVLRKSTTATLAAGPLNNRGQTPVLIRAHTCVPDV